MECNCAPAIWQQGDLIPSEFLTDLGLQYQENAHWVLVSHDCDINNLDFDKEPNAEIIQGEIITVLSGEDSNAKHSRRLDLEFSDAGSPIRLKLRAATKTQINRRALLTLPSPNIKLDRSKLFILRKWLAARYKRAAFANEFNIRLGHKFSKKDTLLKRFQGHLDGSGELIRAVLFDVDKGRPIERDSSTAYELTIVLLYQGTSESGELCDEICQKIEADFRAAFFHNNRWNLIQLNDCIPMSEEDMRVYELVQFDEYSLDHLSMDTEEKQDSLLE